MAIIGVLNGNEHVVEWSQVWPGAIIIKTTGQIAKKDVMEFLHAHFPCDYFMVADFDVPGTIDGWVDRKVWDFIRNS